MRRSPGSPTPPQGSSKAAGTEGGEGNFGDLLKQAIGSVVEAGRNSDAQSKALAGGKANIVDVVTAVAETEVADGGARLGARQGHPGLRRDHAHADLMARLLIASVAATGLHPSPASREGQAPARRTWESQ